MLQLKCCGAEKPVDWAQNAEHKLPDSCCLPDNSKCSDSVTGDIEDYYKQQETTDSPSIHTEVSVYLGPMHVHWGRCSHLKTYGMCHNFGSLFCKKSLNNGHIFHEKNP